MPKPEIAFVNGQYLPIEAAGLAFSDGGFVQGVTLAEQLRTFAGVPFQVAEHLDRLFTGAAFLNVDPPYSKSAVTDAINHVVAHNRDNVAPASDLGVTVFLTPGTYPAYPQTGDDSPRLVVHSYPLAFDRWKQRYRSGFELTTVNVRQIPGNCWPAGIKCRSRMHYYLAAQEGDAESAGHDGAYVGPRWQRKRNADC